MTLNRGDIKLGLLIGGIVGAISIASALIGIGIWSEKMADRAAVQAVAEQLGALRERVIVLERDNVSSEQITGLICRDLGQLENKVERLHEQ